MNIADLMQLYNDAILRGGPRGPAPQPATGALDAVRGAGRQTGSAAAWEAFLQDAPIRNGVPNPRAAGLPGIESLSMMPRSADAPAPLASDPTALLAKIGGAGDATAKAASAATVPDWATAFNLVAQKPGAPAPGALTQTFQVGDKPAYSASFVPPSAGSAPWQLMGMSNPDLEVRARGGVAMNQGQANRSTDALMLGRGALGGAGGGPDITSFIRDRLGPMTSLMAQPGEFGGASPLQARNAAISWLGNDYYRQGGDALAHRKLDIDLMESMAKTKMMEKEFEDRYSPAANLQKMIDAAEVQARGAGKTEAEVASALAPMRDRLAAMQSTQSRGGAAAPAATAPTAAPASAPAVSMDDIQRQLGSSIFDLLKTAQPGKAGDVMPIRDFGTQVHQLSQQPGGYLTPQRIPALLQYMNDRYGPETVNKYLAEPSLLDAAGAGLRNFRTMFSTWEDPPEWEARKMLRKSLTAPRK